MELDEVRALARRNEEEAKVMLSSFQAFKAWMEEAPRRWKGSLLLEELGIIKQGVELRNPVQGRDGTDEERAWICCREDSPGRFVFSPIELSGGDEGWEQAKKMNERGRTCLPARLFWSAFSGLVTRIGQGEFSGEEWEASELLAREVMREFDNHR